MDKTDLEAENKRLRDEIDRLSQELARERQTKAMIVHQRNSAQDNVAELAASLAMQQQVPVAIPRSELTI